VLITYKGIMHAKEGIIKPLKKSVSPVRDGMPDYGIQEVPLIASIGRKIFYLHQFN
jgi:hypothetical protein